MRDEATNEAYLILHAEIRHKEQIRARWTFWWILHCNASSLTTIRSTDENLCDIMRGDDDDDENEEMENVSTMICV